MSLRVGIDITLWPTGRGNGRFVRSLVPRLAALHPEDEWTLYIEEQSAATVEVPGAAVLPVRQRRPAADVLSGGGVRGAIDLARLAIAPRGRHDVFLSPSLTSYYPVLGVPSVVGIHDAAGTTHARMVLHRRRDRLFWRLKKRLALSRGDRFFTVSEYGREQICAHLGVPASELAVVPLAAAPAFKPRPDSEVDAALAEFGLSRERGYLLSFAGSSLHKDPETLLRAFASLAGRPHAPPLVVVGSPGRSDPDTANARLGRQADALGLMDSVVFTGQLTDEPLACLYGGATAVVLPSITESFGLCSVEAAACRAPVIASDIGGHRGTLGDAGLYFPVGDHEALAAQLERVFGAGEGERKELARRGAEAAARFSWDQSARRVRGLLAEAAGG